MMVTNPRPLQAMRPLAVSMSRISSVMSYLPIIYLQERLRNRMKIDICINWPLAACCLCHGRSCQPRQCLHHVAACTQSDLWQDVGRRVLKPFSHARLWRLKWFPDDFPSNHLNDQSSSAAASISVQNCALISLALANLGDWSMAGIGGSWWTKLLTFKPGQGFGYVQGDLDRKDTSYLLQTRLRVSDTSRLSTIFQFYCFLFFLTIRISFRWNHGNLKKLMWLSLSLKSTQWNIQILSPASRLLGFWLLRVRCEHK